MEQENKKESKQSKVNYDEIDENDIDGALKEELKAKGLEYRFIDFKQAKMLGGASRAGWRVYQRTSKSPDTFGIDAFTDPDGLTRKGTLVLAVKPTQLAQRQRDRINHRRKILNGYNKQVASEVEAKAKRLGGSSHAIVGYEKNS